VTNDAVLLLLGPSELAAAAFLIERARQLTKPSGVLVLAVVATMTEEPGSFDGRALAGHEIAATGRGPERVEFVRAGRLRMAVQRSLLGVARTAMARPVPTLPLTAPAALALALVSFVCNSAALAARRRVPPGSCSSFVAVFGANRDSTRVGKLQVR
jgi:hypothetical protein